MLIGISGVSQPPTKVSFTFTVRHGAAVRISDCQTIIWRTESLLLVPTRPLLQLPLFLNWGVNIFKKLNLLVSIGRYVNLACSFV